MTLLTVHTPSLAIHAFTSIWDMKFDYPVVDILFMLGIGYTTDLKVALDNLGSFLSILNEL